MNDILVLSNSVSIEGVPDKIKLIPLGLVKSQKGDFMVDMESYDLMQKYFKGRMLDLVVDYEHQTLDNVQAPAAGWIKDMEVTTDGIYGRVEWTSKAKDYIANKEYRYLSPVVMIRKSDKKAVRLHSIALTNTPAIDAMTPIVNSLTEGEEDTSSEMNNQSDFIDSIKKLLSLSSESTLEDIYNQILELLNQTQNLELKLNSVKFETHKKEAKELVLTALKSGKLIPPQREWAERMALKDIDDFKDWIDNAPQIVPMGTIVKGYDNNISSRYSGKSKSSRSSELLGVSEDDYTKYNSR